MFHEDRDRSTPPVPNIYNSSESPSFRSERRMMTTPPTLSRTTAILFGNANTTGLVDIGIGSTANSSANTTNTTGTTGTTSTTGSSHPNQQRQFHPTSSTVRPVSNNDATITDHSLLSSLHYYKDDMTYDEWNHEYYNSDGIRRRGRTTPNVSGIHTSYIDRVRTYFFGFMYEEMELEDSIENYHNPMTISTTNATGSSAFLRWTKNRSFLSLTMPIAISLALQSMATAMIYTITSSIGYEIIIPVVETTSNYATSSSSSSTSVQIIQIQLFVQQIVSVSILGTAIGKFCNGPVVDIYGARRTAVTYACIMCTVLFVLGSISTTSIASYVIYCVIFIMEFVSSVQWPCTIVILATHYRGGGSHCDDTGTSSTSNTNGSWYESGIFITSLSSRIGSMMGILFSSYLIRNYATQWRTIVYIAAYITAIASSVVYLFVRDSQQLQNEPQNPIDPALFIKWFPEQSLRNKRWSVNRSLRLLMFVVRTNVLPSVRHIFGSGTFWIVTLAHTGTSMVRTSQRLLGSYFLITSDGTLSYEQAIPYSIWYSTGTVLGLFIAGTIFTRGCHNDRQRKYMILRLYIVTILSCYILSITAIPIVRTLIQAPELIRVIQIMAVTTIGFGVAVQLYHIPSLVGATFGCDKGLFVSYNDGVAYLFVAVAWRYVGHAMQLQNDNEMNNDGHGGGWAYGWAAVALLLIFSAFLMVEFMEHYFCRPKNGGGGTYETIIFA